MFPQNHENSIKNWHSHGSSGNYVVTVCQNCGRNNVHTRLIRRKKKSCPTSRTVKRSIRDTDYQEHVPVERRINPWKSHDLNIY
jgi:hypothetical protein